jgi:hypothetical protein
VSRASARPDSIHQLKITLEEIDPPVWRRVLLPSSFTLDQVHAATQAVMGWSDTHLHEFEIDDARYASADEDDFDDDDADDERLTRLADVAPVKSSFTYTYDFGDDWRHRIDVEDVVAPEPGVTYPRCAEGGRACPPEDVGGASGYEHFLEAVGDPGHEEHRDYLDWVGGSFDPASFDLALVQRRLARLSR